MENNNCIFCKIVKGEISSVKIWEDDKNIAILGNRPNMEGMTVVITKTHYNSNVTNMPDKAYTELMLAAKKVAKFLDKKLKVQRTSIVMEGMGVNHAHIKLYPLHGLNKKFTKMRGDKEVYFGGYEGYITTLDGPKKSIEELNKIANKILG